MKSSAFAYSLAYLRRFYRSTPAAGDVGDDSRELPDQRIISLSCSTKLRNILGRSGEIMLEVIATCVHV